MATAVCASAKHAASYQFSGCVKPKELLGQSPLPEREPPNVLAPQSPATANRQPPTANR
jgi:hypothetical protein